MSYLFQNYKRANVEFVKAELNELLDTNGNKYLDFSSDIGVTNLGFHPYVKEQLEKQVAQIWHTPNLYLNTLQEDVAQLLVRQYDYCVYFCNSGAEANEAAIKLARKYTGKQSIICFDQSFHGRTYGAMSATGQGKIKAGFGDVVPHFSYAKFNDINSVKSLITKDTAAIMLELIQGESGIHVAKSSFIKQLSQLCHAHDILLIVDEVQTGIGRTGKCFAFEHYDIEPDIVTSAKGLANGVPVGAMLGKRRLSHVFDYGSHGSTFGGNKLAMTAAKATLEIINKAHFLNHVSKKSEELFFKLNNALVDNPHIIDIRGKGLMIGIETDLDLSQLVVKARERGLIILTAGQNVIRLLPPLTISSQEINRAIRVLRDIFNES
ncbi:acetylornithine transaminase [Staphylococcus epidermidis]|nr:acetylornithine transaminase [Staphylococcus epidermidis]